MSKIVIPLSNGFSLVAEQNVGEFNKEVFIGIEDKNGKYWQDLAVVRPTYKCTNNEIILGADKFEILVFGDADNEDYTDKYVVPLHKDDEE